MTSLKVWVCAAAILAFGPARSYAQKPSSEVCARPAAGSTISPPEDLHSQDGVLKVELSFRNYSGPDGRARYCYVSTDGSEAPTLRLKPGDLLVLKLKNDLSIASSAAMRSAGLQPAAMAMPMVVPDACASTKMTASSTNLHFHGLTIPATCHQDDVIRTMVQPGDAPFEYRFRIPLDEPPGLYWYHPHVHGYTNAQVLGGASGAMIIEGIERADRDLAGMPERVFIVRDQDLENPDAAPAMQNSIALPPALLDAEGDALNTGNGTGKPAKDLSLNFVPVSYPDYKPAVISVKPSERELWRVLNASAITYLNLQVLYNGAAQALGVVALDGVPINQPGMAGTGVLWQSHLGVPPGGRIEFILKSPANGVNASLITRSVNTGTAGENDPERPLATIEVSEDSPESQLRLPQNPEPVAPQRSASLDKAQPARTRHLYFSERPQNPDNPKSPTVFMLTVEGQPEEPFNPQSTVPNIIARQGDVEDWIIENRTQEVHAFHIHQIHFMLLEWFGLPVNEPFLYDTVNVPFWDGKSKVYPVIKVRMDFRDPNAVGTFVYHCHILEHEDGGMMGTIRVEPNGGRPKLSALAGGKMHVWCGPVPTRPITGIKVTKKPPRQVFNASVIAQ